MSITVTHHPLEGQQEVDPDDLLSYSSSPQMNICLMATREGASPILNFTITAKAPSQKSGLLGLTYKLWTPTTGEKTFWTKWLQHLPGMLQFSDAMNLTQTFGDYAKLEVTTVYVPRNLMLRKGHITDETIRAQYWYFAYEGRPRGPSE